MPYPNEHAARLKSPDMEHIRVRRTKGSGKGTVQGVKIPTSISVIWYIVKKDGEEVPVAQALRFPTSKWSASEAKSWLKDHDIKYILFEEATGEKRGGDGMEGKALGHNNTLEDGEPSWGDVDKTKLPFKAFVWEASDTDKEKVSTWRYPHHWVKSGGDPDDNGRYTSGDMYLHEGGLNAGWVAAQGARTGEKAEQAIISHLEKHRKAIGKDEEEGSSKTSAIGSKVIDKDARRVSTIRNGNDLQAKARLGKAKKNDPGHVEGYAAIWNNVDLGGEIMRRGAFVKSISERVAAGKVKLMARHFAYGGDVPECIGTVTEAKEDDTGLWYRAKFASTELAQTVRTLILEGHVDTCSVGYMPVKWNWLTVGEGAGSQVLEHTECKFFEVTVTVVPMNEEAKLTAAKSLTEVASKVQDIAKELGVSETDAPSDEQKAAILEGAFGGEAEAKALKESLTSLCAELDRLLVKSEPGDTSSKRKEADSRRRKLDIEKKRLELLDS